MTDDLAIAAASIVERTRREQGLPRHVEDTETLHRVAAAMLHEGVRHARVG